MTAILPSLTKLKPNPAWASLPLFDRTGWKRMAFGAFAESIGERAEPKDAQEEIYVGLEHLDPLCLHIRRWGKGSDVTGTKLRFRKGDIIFGRRRAYQRKLAVAEFDGICSAHAMVVRARPDKVLPEFLPFLMMSDRFMNRAVEISVGSLSPTINWTTLKLEEFDLPPLDQQRRIAEILWAADEVGLATANLLRACESSVKATAHDAVFPFGHSPTQAVLDARYGSRYVTRKADDLYEVASGNGEPTSSEDGDVIYFKVNDFNLNADERFLERGGTRFDSEANPKIRIFPPRSVIFPKRGASIFLNKVGVTRFPVALDPNLMGLVPNERVIRSEYLYWLIKLTQLGRIADTTSLPQLNHKHLLPLVFPVPSLGAQDEFLDRVDQLRTAQSAAETNGETLKEIGRAIINRIASP